MARRPLLALAVLALTAGTLGSLPSTPAFATSCPSGWTATTSDNPSADYNFFADVSAVSIDEAWAVGFERETGQDQTLAEHWTGSAWAAVPTPDLSALSNNLEDVAALATDNAWAVGDYYDGSDTLSLIEQWTGASWAVVASPSPGDTETDISSVTAIAPDDIWAVGTYDQAGVFRTLALHWNGLSWTQIPTPNPSSKGDFLNAVSGTSATNVWAAGTRKDKGAVYHTLVERWNGTSWKVVPSKNQGIGDSEPSSIVAISKKNVWIGGNSRNNADNSRVFIQHWNGTKMSVATVPSLGNGDQLPYDMAASGANDVWFVGSYETNSVPSYNTLVLHWNGNHWKASTGSNPGADTNTFTGVAAVAPGTLFAVGRQADPAHTLAETMCP